jgi:hypothetical protein
MPTFSPEAALFEPLALGVLVVLLPQPARVMTATEATATIFIDDLKALSLCMHHIRTHRSAHFS